MTVPAVSPLAEQLLDAQVSWCIERLTGDELPGLVTRAIGDAYTVAEQCTTSQLVDVGQVKALARQLSDSIPPSAAATTLAEVSAGVLMANPAGEYTLRELIDRENVERITAEVLALTPALERVLDDLTRSPLVASLASQFVGRIVNDVLAGNRAVAAKIPGVGSLVNIGTTAAGKVIGKTGEQFEQMFGDTAAKGAEFMMGRLNKIILATLNDPRTGVAVLEVFDLYADRPAGRHDSVLSEDDAQRIASLAQDVAIPAAASAPVRDLIDALIDAFFQIYADYPAATLLEDLDLGRDALTAHALAFSPRVISAAVATGEVERAVREQLAPFYSSPAVAAILSTP